MKETKSDKFMLALFMLAIVVFTLISIHSYFKCAEWGYVKKVGYYYVGQTQYYGQHLVWACIEE
jgi:hypothetical protein